MDFYKKILVEIESNNYWRNLKGKIKDEKLIKKVMKKTKFKKL